MWNNLNEYIEGQKIVSYLKIVNDPAERNIKWNNLTIKLLKIMIKNNVY